MDDFLKMLEDWKENYWIIFASQSTTETTKKFLCNLNGKYKITLKSEKKPIYQGADMEEAYKIYKML